MNIFKCVLQASLGMLLIGSCTQGSEMPTTQQVSSEPKSADLSVDLPSTEMYEGMPILSFESQGQLDSYLVSLAGLSEEDLAKQGASLGVQSFLATAKMYSDKLDDLVASLEAENASFEYARRRVNELQQESAPYLLYREGNWSGISRARSRTESAVANQKGYYRVAGKLRKLSLYASIMELEQNCLRKEIDVMLQDSSQLRSLNVADGEAGAGRRRVRGEINADPFSKTIFLSFEGHKKNIFGHWIRYSTQYDARIAIQDLSAKFNLAEAAKSAGLYPMRKVDLYSIAVDLANLGTKPAPMTLEKYVPAVINVSTKFDTKRYTLTLGTFDLENEQEPDNYGAMKGILEVWSRGVSYNDRGRANFSIDFGYNDK